MIYLNLDVFKLLFLSFIYFTKLNLAAFKVQDPHFPTTA